jgi:hypothetical protein
MQASDVTFCHHEISLLLFALEGGKALVSPDVDSCEEACPVVESVEELLCGGTIDLKKQLIRHLNNHLREALIECGMFELMATVQQGATQSGSIEERAQLERANQRLALWTCQIKFDDEERRLLDQALSRLSRASWITMPRTMWRLKRKLKQ